MLSTRARALAVALVVATGFVATPIAVPAGHVEAATLLAGSSAYQAVAPYRLADTRPEEGAYGFTWLSGNTVRVQVAGRGGVPANASAAVLTVTAVNTTAPGFVTVFPAGTAMPTASNLNIDYAGQVMANMVTVKLGAGGSVDIFMQRAMDVVVDVSGAYVPVSASVSAGRLVTRADGAYRVLDTRDRKVPVSQGQSERVDVSAAGVPADAAAVVVNVTVTNTAVGFWTAYPIGQPLPKASNVNIDHAGQTRAAQAIVLLSGAPAFNVFSMAGGDLIVDVTGWFTGSTAPKSLDGLFVPTNPTRLVDTRDSFVMPAWGGTTLELSVHAPDPQISAVAVNLTGTESLIGGYMTAFPAGVSKPNVSNLNVDDWDQTIANHAIVRVSNRGMSLYTLQALHMIADLNGWYLGAPSTAVLPTPTIPAYGPSTALEVDTPSIGMGLAVGTGTNLDAVANLGIAATWNGKAEVGVPGNVVLFGHRTSHGAPFLNINVIPIGSFISLVGTDGHSYNYVVVRHDVTAPYFPTINNIGLTSGKATVQLVACTPPHSTKYRWVTTARLVSVT